MKTYPARPGVLRPGAPVLNHAVPSIVVGIAGDLVVVSPDDGQDIRFCSGYAAFDLLLRLDDPLGVACLLHAVADAMGLPASVWPPTLREVLRPWWPDGGWSMRRGGELAAFASMAEALAGVVCYSRHVPALAGLTDPLEALVAIADAVLPREKSTDG